MSSFNFNALAYYAFDYDTFVFQVMASKTKIYIVLEFVDGGELFDKVVRDFLYQILIFSGRKIENKNQRLRFDVHFHFKCINLMAS